MFGGTTKKVLEIKNNSYYYIGNMGGFVLDKTTRKAEIILKNMFENSIDFTKTSTTEKKPDEFYLNRMEKIKEMVTLIENSPAVRTFKLMEQLLEEEKKQADKNGDIHFPKGEKLGATNCFNPEMLFSRTKHPDVELYISLKKEMNDSKHSAEIYKK